MYRASFVSFKWHPNRWAKCSSFMGSYPFKQTGVCFINMTIFPWEELRKQTGATASVECSSKSQQDALKQLWRLAYKGSSSSQINVLLSARLQFGKEVSKDISNRMEKELDTFHVPDSSFARLNDDKNSVIERDGKNGSSRYADGNDAGS